MKRHLGVERRGIQRLSTRHMIALLTGKFSRAKPPTCPGSSLAGAFL
jgi:hypothetical protein